uniref:Neur_chan_LBD domain-containing protein n=1 Tax=Caenorhabditis japonica TaxID=281687 RepID=A0A8R1E4U7_CAEJA
MFLINKRGQRNERLRNVSVAKRVAAKYTGGPVLVTVNIYLRSISKIDDVNMEYSAQFTFREEWTDQRLAYERYEESGDTEVPPFVVLATSENADQSQQIWMPDTFFQNEKFVFLF